MPALPAKRSTSRSGQVGRGRSRRVSGDRPGLVTVGRVAATVCVAVLLVVAGVWASWGTAQHVVLSDSRERGTLTVAECGEDRCSGAYVPSSPGSEARERVVVDRSIDVRKGARLSVVVKPGSSEVVRTGAGGFFHAWMPLGGALVLAGVVVGGGLRLTRVAWGTGLLGAALLGAAFVTL
ncbi:hypothetical protein [Streptomyces sp. YIM 130001]|uniref:hypothetical protein n=1 Tax=Streptomyces sp. YIM 130001 TaxID=2259644 RepID=UPI001F0922D9|nr:hypothetical protein [Streptomyces sp. YIM 130001]